MHSHTLRSSHAMQHAIVAHYHMAGIVTSNCAARCTCKMSLNHGVLNDGVPCQAARRKLAQAFSDAAVAQQIQQIQASIDAIRASILNLNAPVTPITPVVNTPSVSTPVVNTPSGFTPVSTPSPVLTPVTSPSPALAQQATPVVARTPPPVTTGGL